LKAADHGRLAVGIGFQTGQFHELAADEALRGHMELEGVLGDIRPAIRLAGLQLDLSVQGAANAGVQSDNFVACAPALGERCLAPLPISLAARAQRRRRCSISWRATAVWAALALALQPAFAGFADHRLVLIEGGWIGR